MSEDTFLYLCDEIRPFLTREDTSMRIAVSTKKRVAVMLWRVAANTDYPTIGHLFGLARGTV